MKTSIENNEQKGRILTVETGNNVTKAAYFIDGKQVFEEKISHSREELEKYSNIMDQEKMRRDSLLDMLKRKGIELSDIDLIMARGGLFAPVRTGVYKVNRDMRDVLLTCRDGVHACNLSAVVADDIAEIVNDSRSGNCVASKPCNAYIADPPMADEMLPECRIGGLPEFPRRAFFHALNSRATVKKYLKEQGRTENDITAIVAHIGAGITVTLHRNGEVIDTNNGLGGDGPFTGERAGTCPALPLVEMCFSGRYTEGEIKRKLLVEGGAMAYFGTNNLNELEDRALKGDKDCSIFMNSFSLNIAKHIAAESATVCGKVDVILLTGPGACSSLVTDAIIQRVNHIALVKVYAGENEARSLADNGYSILEGTAQINRYDKTAIVPTEE